MYDSGQFLSLFFAGLAIAYLLYMVHSIGKKK